MSERNLYAILGVGRDANPAAIKQAYGRRAFESHLNAGFVPDPEQFRRIHEAYAVLGDPARRRRYDREPGSISALVEPVAHPRRRSVIVPDDFQTIAPSLGEVLDHIAQNFFGFHRKSEGPLHRLGLEVVLEPEEARFGASVPIEVPVYRTCLPCGGSGAGWPVCARCHGYGIAEDSARVVLEVPAGIRGGERFEVGLQGAGIRNLVLGVRIAVFE